MHIKKLELSDVKIVNEIRNYYIENTNYIFRRHKKTYDEDYEFFSECLNKNYPVHVVEENKEIIGFAYLYPFRSLDGYDKTFELSIYVKPNLKQKGIGSILLQQIESTSKDICHTIISVITSDNLNSIRFHEKNGFTTIGTMRECGSINGMFLDATFMQKLL